MTPRLREKYESEILQALAEKLGRKNRHALPRLQKIVINMGVGSGATEKKHVDEAVDALTMIAGQKPIVTKARISICGFTPRRKSSNRSGYLRLYNFAWRIWCHSLDFET